MDAEPIRQYHYIVVFHAYLFETKGEHQYHGNHVKVIRVHWPKKFVALFLIYF